MGVRAHLVREVSLDSAVFHDWVGHSVLMGDWPIIGRLSVGGGLYTIGG